MSPPLTLGALARRARSRNRNERTSRRPGGFWHWSAACLVASVRHQVLATAPITAPLNCTTTTTASSPCECATRSATTSSHLDRSPLTPRSAVAADDAWTADDGVVELELLASAMTLGEVLTDHHAGGVPELGWLRDPPGAVNNFGGGVRHANCSADRPEWPGGRLRHAAQPPGRRLVLGFSGQAMSSDSEVSSRIAVSIPCALAGVKVNVDFRSAGY